MFTNGKVKNVDKYLVYFEFYGKKMRAEVDTKIQNEILNFLRSKIYIHKILPKQIKEENIKTEDVSLEDLKSMFGFF